jgi:hypothetical protein
MPCQTDTQLQRIQVGAGIWLSPAGSTWAAELLHVQAQTVVEGDEPRSAVAAARAWLRAGLTAGPRPASELRQVAAQGIDQNALYAARKPDEAEGDGLPSP